MQTSAAPGETVGRLGGYVARIKAVTRARFSFELRPQLGELQPFCDATPEPVKSISETQTFRGSRFDGRERGCHGSDVIIEERKGKSAIAKISNDLPLK
jgi:hypothetical protein